MPFNPASIVMEKTLKISSAEGRPSAYIWNEMVEKQSYEMPLNNEISITYHSFNNVCLHLRSILRFPSWYIHQSIKARAYKLLLIVFC